VGSLAVCVTRGASFGSLGGYVPQNVSVPSTATLLSARYYDDCSFLNLFSSADRSLLTSEAKDGYGVPVISAGSMKGFLTGTWDSSLGNSSLAAKTAVYYDYLGRQVQRRTVEASGGSCKTYLLNTFTGKVSLCREECKPTDSSAADVLEKSFTYDSQDRPLSETVSLNGVSQSMSYAYDGIGRLSSRTYDTSSSSLTMTQTLDYNVRGDLISQDSDVFHSSLRYNVTRLGSTALYSGGISEWEWRRGSGSPVNAWSLSYDSLGRLVDAARYTGTLSSAGYMTTATSTAVNSFSERNLSYDRNGNIMALTRYGESASVPEDAITYTYSGNRITSIANAGTLGGGGSYAYDANGNITHDGLAELDLEYNLLNLTKKISAGGTTLANYSYLADGTRISAERNDGTGVQYRGSLIYTKASDGTLSLDCALTSGGRIVRQSGSGAAGTYQVQHFVRDHLGSVRSVVDASTGNVLETSDYLPLGKRWSLTGGDSAQTVTDPTNRWRFSGKEDQTFLSTGIAYNDFGARLHDPRTGRWLAVDPMAQKYYGMTVYGYCGGDPVTRVDTDGRIWETVWDIANVVMDAESLVSNVKSGNVGAAIVDGVGLLADVFAATVPFVPGGAGTTIKVARGVDKAADTTIDAISSIGKGKKTLMETATIGQEAHRQIEKELMNSGKAVKIETRVDINNDKYVRKDALLQDGTYVIIKPDTPSGHNAAKSRQKLLKENNITKTKIKYYNPDNPAFLPSSPSYIGPKNSNKWK